MTDVEQALKALDREINDRRAEVTRLLAEIGELRADKALRDARIAAVRCLLPSYHSKYVASMSIHEALGDTFERGVWVQSDAPVPDVLTETRLRAEDAEKRVRELEKQFGEADRVWYDKLSAKDLECTDLAQDLEKANALLNRFREERDQYKWRMATAENRLEAISDALEGHKLDKTDPGCFPLTRKPSDDFGQKVLDVLKQALRRLGDDPPYYGLDDRSGFEMADLLGLANGCELAKVIDEWTLQLGKEQEDE